MLYGLWAQLHRSHFPDNKCVSVSWLGKKKALTENRSIGILETEYQR